MPRFSMKSLLVATAVVALWLSTLTGPSTGNEVRQSIVVLVILASAFAAFYGSGRRRAFWTGFFVVILFSHSRLEQVCALEIPNFLGWVADALPLSGMNDTAAFRVEMRETTGMASAVILATLAGYIAAYIYDKSQQNKDG